MAPLNKKKSDVSNIHRVLNGLHRFAPTANELAKESSQIWANKTKTPPFGGI